MSDGKHVTVSELINSIHESRALIFDFDGTIADTESIHFLAYNEALHNLGSTLELEEFRTYLGKETNYVYDEIKRIRGLAFDNATFLKAKTKAFLNLSKQENLQCFYYFPQIVEAFPHTPAFIVSAQERIIITELLERWCYKAYFQDVLTTTEIGSKEHCIEILCDQLALAPADMAYFEDSHDNVSLGKSLGLTTIGIKGRLNGDAVEHAAFVLDVRDECRML